MSRFNTMNIEIEIYEYLDKYKNSIYDLEDKADEIRELVDTIFDKIVEEEGLEE